MISRKEAVRQAKPISPRFRPSPENKTMVESSSLLAAVLIEAVLLLLIVVGGVFWFLKNRGETPAKTPGLSFPDELAGHARRFLENEIASTREQMETRGEADDTHPALDLRLTALSAELDGLDLTEARDSFWRHINEHYGAKAATPARISEPAAPPPRNTEPEAEPESAAATDAALTELAADPAAGMDGEADMDDIDRLLAESQPQSASETAVAEPEEDPPPAETNGAPGDQSDDGSPSPGSEKPGA